MVENSLWLFLWLFLNLLKGEPMLCIRTKSSGVSVVEYGLVAVLLVLVIAGSMLAPNIIRQFFAGTVNSADGSVVPSFGTTVSTGNTTNNPTVLGDNNSDPTVTDPSDLCAILSIACGNNGVTEVAAALGASELNQMFDALITLTNQMDLPPDNVLLIEIMNLADMGHTIAGGIAEIEAVCPEGVCAGMAGAVGGNNLFDTNVDSLFSDTTNSQDSEALNAFLSQYYTVWDMYFEPGDYGMEDNPIPPDYQDLFAEIITIASYNIENILNTLNTELSYDGTTTDLGGAGSMEVNLNSNNICATSGSMTCFSD